MLISPSVVPYAGASDRFWHKPPFRVIVLDRQKTRPEPASGVRFYGDYWEIRDSNSPEQELEHFGVQVADKMEPWI